MPTNEERRKIAARLRRFKSDEVSSYSEYLEKLDEIIGINGCEETGDRLADLIEPETERTCYVTASFTTPTMLYSIQEYTCSKCDKQTLSEVLGDDEDVPKYCSYCGAKVVE